MLSQLGKELYNTQRRIFDHQPFLANEIESFRRNFEAKRNDCEVEQLFKSTEIAGEIKYDLLGRCLALGQTNLPQLAGELDTVLGKAENFLTEVKREKPVSENFTQSRLERAQRKDNFCKDLEYSFLRVANSLEEKEEEISDLYSDLQIKLNIPK